ncbi:conserved hypothetical protein [Hyphomicrobiales bacterium]|jgi:hypothetical protein|nr:conserved hypothetical protein [Hyphomicrobiales bacterium]CAH1702329.1 hypothetical protein BOSEA1005_30201 [Hyphomicrobiales bacterium]CAI0346530.1 conserved hypothetical protein [Hyphomicrobiales bacterium]
MTDFVFTIGVPTDLEPSGIAVTTVPVAKGPRLFAQVAEAMRSANRAVSSRYVNYDDFPGDSLYLEKMDSVGEQLRFQKLAFADGEETRKWSMEGHFDDEEITHEEVIEAATEEQAKVIMAFNTVLIAGMPAAFEYERTTTSIPILEYAESMEACDCALVEQPENAPTQEFEELVANLVRNARAEGIELDGLQEVIEALDAAGVDTAPSAAPGLR